MTPAAWHGGTLTIYHLLLTTIYYHVLLATCYLLLATCFLLLTSLLTTYYLRLTTYYRRDPWHGGGLLRPSDAVVGGALCGKHVRKAASAAQPAD